MSTMFTFQDVVATTKKTRGKNLCNFIILHHTGGGTYKSNLRVLSGKTGSVSAHFLVGPKGECAKIGQPEDILWHAGKSNRGKLIDMNSYSMGIEIVGPGFTNEQFERVVELVRHLQQAFGIEKENVICHHDITWAGSINKQLWDGKSKCRKPDVARELWADRGFSTFNIFREKKLL